MMLLLGHPGYEFFHEKRHLFWVCVVLFVIFSYGVQV